MVRPTAPGLKDVAAHAGVSVSTVSRVINDGPYVTETVRARVTASMAALGYEPHALAQSLRTGQSNTVGYVIGDIANPLFATIAGGMDDVLQQASYTIFLGNSRGDAAHELQLIKALLRRRVDGLVLSLADETDAGLRTLLRQLSVPLVLLDREVPGVRADRVLVEHDRGIRRAVQHLHELGHRRVALITGAPITLPGRAIRHAFEETVAELGLPRSPADVLVVPPSGPVAPAEVAALLGREPRPTALIAGGATLAPAVLRALRELGLRVPDDLSLVAYDDTDVTALHAPPLTVVARDVRAIGAQAARLMLDRIAAPAGRRRTVAIPTALVVRGSTAAPGGGAGDI